MSLLLAVDLGNTLVKCALFEGSSIIARRHDRVGAKPDDVIAALLEIAPAARRRVGAAAICSVVPKASDGWRLCCRKLSKKEPLIIAGSTSTPLKNLYSDPDELGPDRLAAAVAAAAFHGTPVIVVSIGTAVTVDAVSGKGEFLGGAIAIGPETALEALAQRAARLPEVEFSPEAAPIGRSSSDCLKSGALFGTVGAINELVRLQREELGRDTRLVLSGGLWEFVAPRIAGVSAVEPDLVLQGVRLIWEHVAKAN
jgi:type III pantothenate kinase